MKWVNEVFIALFLGVEKWREESLDAVFIVTKIRYGSLGTNVLI